MLLNLKYLIFLSQKVTFNNRNLDILFKVSSMKAMPLLQVYLFDRKTCFINFMLLYRTPPNQLQNKKMISGKEFSHSG